MSGSSHMRLEDRLPDAAPAPGGAIDPSALLGTWYNTDKQSRGIVRLELATEGDQLTVRAYGACTPEPCDWRTVPARIYAASIGSLEGMAFSAHYRFDFVEVILAAYTKQGILVLDTLNTFTDGSPRANYFTREFFHR